MVVQTAFLIVLKYYAANITELCVRVCVRMLNYVFLNGSSLFSSSHENFA